MTGVKSAHTYTHGSMSMRRIFGAFRYVGDGTEQSSPRLDTP